MAPLLEAAFVDTRIIAALRKLVEQGWLPLRQLSPLLGYSHPTGIYSRQVTNNPIPTIKVGGTYRVYAADIVDVLHNVKLKDREAAEAILMKYRQLLKEYTVTQMERQEYRDE